MDPAAQPPDNNVLLFKEAIRDVPDDSMIEAIVEVVF